MRTILAFGVVRELLAVFVDDLVRWRELDVTFAFTIFIVVRASWMRTFTAIWHHKWHMMQGIYRSAAVNARTRYAR